jgi:hypothetical protein
MMKKKTYCNIFSPCLYTIPLLAIVYTASTAQAGRLLNSIAINVLDRHCLTNITINRIYFRDK